MSPRKNQLILVLVLIFMALIVVCGPTPATQAPAETVTQVVSTPEPTIAPAGYLVAVFSSPSGNHEVRASEEDQFIVALDLTNTTNICVTQGWIAQVHTAQGETKTFSAGNWTVEETFKPLWAMVYKD